MLASASIDADALGAPCISQEHLQQLRSKLVRYLSKHLHQQDAAEDVAHEALLSYLASPAQFENRSTLSTYLIGIARHKLADLLRDRCRQAAVQAYGETMTDGQHTQESSVAHHAFWKSLTSALRQLPPRQREAFYRSVVRDEESDVIARDLGITVNHLGVLVFRARRRLRASPALNAAADALIRGG